MLVAAAAAIWLWSLIPVCKTERDACIYETRRQDGFPYIYLKELRTKMFHVMSLVLASGEYIRLQCSFLMRGGPLTLRHLAVTNRGMWWILALCASNGVSPELVHCGAHVLELRENS